jgi:hypothetical protein
MQTLLWEVILTLNSHAKTKKDGHSHKVNQLNKGTVYFKIFHQNIRGLGKKAEELLSHLHPDFLHVLCLTEHHLKYLQLENYNLGAHYCRQLCAKGGAAIFVHNSLRYSNINIAQHCKEQDIEICALKLSFGTLNICVNTTEPLLEILAASYSSSTQLLNHYIHPSYTSLSVGT